MSFTLPISSVRSWNKGISCCRQNCTIQFTQLTRKTKWSCIRDCLLLQYFIKSDNLQCACACVRPSVIHVVVLCFRDISEAHSTRRYRRVQLFLVFLILLLVKFQLVLCRRLSWLLVSFNHKVKSHCIIRPNSKYTALTHDRHADMPGCQSFRVHFHLLWMA